RSRGLDKFLEGKLDTNRFARNLSKEFASLPDPKTGRSYYDKDGLNKSLVSLDKVLSTLGEIQSFYDNPNEEVQYDYVEYGTPEYTKAYKEGRFVNHLNQLDEVVIDGSNKKKVTDDIPSLQKGGNMSDNGRWL